MSVLGITKVRVESLALGFGVFQIPHPSRPVSPAVFTHLGGTFIAFFNLPCLYSHLSSESAILPSEVLQYHLPKTQAHSLIQLSL